MRANAFWLVLASVAALGTYAPSALAQQPKLTVALGHAYPFTAVAWSPDGRHILTGSGDRTLKLWDARTGKEIRSYQWHTDWVKAVEFSRDGKLALSAGGHDGTARLWDIATGAELLKVGEEKVGEGKPEMKSASISPDGRVLLTAADGGAVRLWEAKTGRPIRSIRGGGRIAAFSPDGRLIAGAMDTGSLSLWDAATGALVRPFERIVSPGEIVDSIAFSPDGSHVLTAGWDNTLRLWSVALGRQVRNFVGHTKYVTSARFSPDGRLIASGGNDNTVRLWDAATGRQLRVLAGHTEMVWSVAFSPDGTHVVSGSGAVLLSEIDKTARIWEVASGKEVMRLRGYTSTVAALTPSPDGRYVLAAHDDGTAKLWDLRQGRPVRVLPGHETTADSVAFSADGMRALTADWRDVKLWATGTGRPLAKLDARSPATFTPDGARILAAGKGGRGGELVLLDAATGARLRTYRGHDEVITSIDVSPDGRTFASASWDRTVRLWSVESGELLGTYPHPDRVYAVAIGRDGATLATACGDGAIRLWDLRPARERRVLRGHTLWATGVAFSADGMLLVSSGADKTVRVWDAGRGTELRVFRGHESYVNAVRFDPGGRILLSGSTDGTIRLWRVADGEQVAVLAAVKGASAEYVVVDPAGRFDGSSLGQRDLLHFVSGDEAIELEQLKERYYEPGLLAKKLGLNPEPLRDVAALATPALHPEVALNRPSPADPVLRVNLANRGGGIGRVVVRVNGKEMTADARRRGADPGAKTLALELPLADYERWLNRGHANRIEVVAYNAAGYLASRAAETVYEPGGRTALPEARLWAVVVGVSDYAGDQIDLRYAAKDAEDVARAVELGGRRLFGAARIRVRLLASGSPAPAVIPTKAAIASAFEELAKASPEDVVLIYLAGHGAAVGNVYYFLTQEAHSTNLDDPEIRRTRAVSSDEVSQWLKSSPAQRQVMVLDTCAAGAAAASLVERRNVSADQVRALERLKDRTGMHLLMGSAADRVSYEASRFEQGLLTHALLRGLKGAALRQDQYVDVSLLFNYVADEVPRLAADVGGIQRPHIAAPRAVRIESFDIGQLTVADRAAIPLRSPKPLVLRPTLINARSAFDDLELEPRLRARLREASFARARGAATGGVAFVEADELPGAIRPSGLYEVKDRSVSAKIVLRRDGAVRELGVEGRRDELDALSERMAQAIVRSSEEWR